MNTNEDLGENRCGLHWVDDELFTSEGTLVGEARSSFDPVLTAQDAAFLSRKKDSPTLDSVLWQIDRLAREGRMSLFLFELQSDTAEALKQLLEVRKFECYLEKYGSSPKFPLGKSNLHVSWAHC